MKRQARIPRRTMAYHRSMELAGIHMEELIVRGHIYLSDLRILQPY